MAAQQQERLEVPAGGIADFAKTDEEIAELEALEAQEDFGDAGIANFSEVAGRMAGYGRFGDDSVAHVKSGEIIVPKELIDNNPRLKEQIFAELMEAGIEDPEQYVVGSSANRINPETGLPEFGFFSKLWKGLKKIVKKVVGVVLPIVGYVFGGPLGAALGSGIATLIQGGDLKDAFKSAAITGLLTYGTTALAAKFAPAGAGPAGPAGAGPAGPAGPAGAGPAGAGPAGPSTVGIADPAQAVTSDFSGQFAQATSGTQIPPITLSRATELGLSPLPQVPGGTGLSAGLSAGAPAGLTTAANFVPSAVSTTLNPAGAAGAAGVVPKAAPYTFTPEMANRQIAQLQLGQAARGAGAGAFTPTSTSFSNMLGDIGAGGGEKLSWYEKAKNWALRGDPDQTKAMAQTDKIRLAGEAEAAEVERFIAAGRSRADAVQAGKMKFNQVYNAPPSLLKTYARPLMIGTGILAATGGFKTPEQDDIGIIPKETGEDLIKRDPGKYMVAQLGRLQFNPATGEYEDTWAEEEEESNSIIASSLMRDNPYLQLPQYSNPPVNVARGGAMYPRRTGGVMPHEGTPNEDSVRALLMPGEFVMTTDAVRGAGNGNLNTGINNMYGIMRNLERVGRVA